MTPLIAFIVGIVEWSVSRHTSTIEAHLSRRDKMIDQRFDLVETELTRIGAETSISLKYINKAIEDLNDCRLP
jgi:hypothetical protein